MNSEQFLQYLIQEYENVLDALYPDPREALLTEIIAKYRRVKETEAQKFTILVERIKQEQRYYTPFPHCKNLCDSLLDLVAELEQNVTSKD